MRIRDILNKFLSRNEASIDSTNNILEMNGAVLIGANDADFDFKSMVIKEVIQYCEDNGINHVDKVVILSLYDADLHNLTRKIIFSQRTISNSESKIIVTTDEDGKVIAQVIFSEYVEIKGDN